MNSPAHAASARAAASRGDVAPGGAEMDPDVVEPGEDPGRMRAMKRFACGDVVPGCDAVWVAPDEDAILLEVSRHAADVHRLLTVPAELRERVRSLIVEA